MKHTDARLARHQLLGVSWKHHEHSLQPMAVWIYSGTRRTHKHTKDFSLNLSLLLFFSFLSFSLCDRSSASVPRLGSTVNQRQPTSQLLQLSQGRIIPPANHRSTPSSYPSLCKAALHTARRSSPPFKTTPSARALRSSFNSHSNTHSITPAHTDKTGSRCDTDAEV